jgi:hypothetical protein
MKWKTRHKYLDPKNKNTMTNILVGRYGGHSAHKFVSYLIVLTAVW